MRLIKRCRELNAEIVANAAKVQTALKLNEEDQGTIATLKKEIEKAWKMVDASHEKEAKAKETIQALKMEIANLTRLVEQVGGLGEGGRAAGVEHPSHIAPAALVTPTPTTCAYMFASDMCVLVCARLTQCAFPSLPPSCHGVPP